jgi:hypothetical protein
VLATSLAGTPRSLPRYVRPVPWPP